MRPLALLRSGCLLLAMGAIPWPSALAYVDPPATPATPPKDQLKAIEGDPVATLDRGQDFERRRNWSAAVQVYRDAAEKWPSRSDFKSRLRLAEMHQRLTRRYQDGSFRDVLLRLPREKAFELFDELLERIEIHYVDAVPLEPLIRRGFDNLEVALRDPKFAFLTINAPNSPPERITWLRDQLRNRRESLFIPDHETARDQVVFACDLARQAIGIGSAAVVLEFVFGCCEALPDDYTAYLTPDKLEDMLATIDGNFVGLGVELKNGRGGVEARGRDPRRSGVRGWTEGGRPDRGRSAGSVGERSRSRRGGRASSGEPRGHSLTSPSCELDALDQEPIDSDPPSRRGRERREGPRSSSPTDGRRLYPAHRVPEVVDR